MLSDPYDLADLFYSSNDDYSGAHITNATIPREYTQVDDRDVVLGRHVIIGSGTVILPGLRLARELPSEL